MAAHDQPAEASSSAAAAQQPAQPTPPPPAQPAPAQQSARASAQPAAYAQYPGAYGQPFQSYQQYGQQAGVPQPQQQQYGYVAAAPQQYGYAYPQGVPMGPLPESKMWVYFKAALHAAAIVVSICTLAMGLSLIPQVGGVIAGITAPVPVFSLIWSAAELIVRAVHKFQRGIHPGGQVAATLLLWLAAIILGILLSLFSVSYDGYCDYDYDPDYGYTQTNCYDPWEGKRGVYIATAAFTCLLWLIYFVLFIGACIDTAKYNASRRAPIVMVNPAYWGPAAQGWQQMPQQAPGTAPQQQQQGPYMTAPQQARTRGSVASGAQGEAIPMQNRSPSPITPYETPMEQVNEKGKQPEQSAGQHGVREYYTPGN